MKDVQRPGQQGFSLVMVLILLGALALASSQALRASSGTEKVGMSWRMQGMALQSAEAALRYCEAQLLLPDAERVPALREAALPVAAAPAPAWAQAARWAPGNLSSPPASWWAAPALAGGPGLAPVCLAEKQPLESVHLLVVTVRGLSPDWRGEASTGATLGGSAAWLQSILLIHEGAVRNRVQRRLVVPPLR